MYEIELKAHVEDKNAVIEKLDSFAEFLISVQKDDVYWGTFVDEKKIQARIRKETNCKTNEEKIFLTYKRKENRIDENGQAYEVNDEKECELSESKAMESLFIDLGMKIVLEKHKNVIGYQYGECHIELCNVPPLGDFLEIEIICETNDEKTVAEKKEKLLEILKLCNIPESKIEKKYYSEMLREFNGEKNV